MTIAGEESSETVTDFRNNECLLGGPGPCSAPFGGLLSNFDLTDLRKTVEIGVDPRLYSQPCFWIPDSEAELSVLTQNSPEVSGPQ